MAINIDDTTRRKAIKILEDEQTELVGAYDKQAVRGVSPGMESEFIPETAELAQRREKRISKDSKGKYSQEEILVKNRFFDESVVDEKETQFKEDAETLQEVCRAYDNEIIRLNNEINAKKLQIVNLSVAAVAGGCTTIHSSYVGLGTTAVSFNEEVEFVKIYPKMAGPGYDPGTDNPFEPDATVQLNKSYAGFGYENVREKQEVLVGSGTTTGIRTDGSGSGIGSAFFIGNEADGYDHGFFFSGVIGGEEDCHSTGDTQQTLYGEIVALRKERDSYRNKLNIIKKNKSDKELSHWGYQNTKSEVNARRNKNASVISAVNELDGADTVQELGLVYYLDAANNSSYFGSGDSWYDISESGEDADNEAQLYGFSVGTNSLEFFEDPFDTLRSHFKFNKNNTSTSGYLNFKVSNNLITDSTQIVTVEMLSQLTLPEVSTANNGGGEVIFAWGDKYSIWTGKNSTGTEPIHLGFTSDPHTQRDLYGLTSAQVNNLGIVNTDPLNERIHNVDPANWAHYVFVFNKGDYTKNKIYINGVSQTLQQITDSAVIDNNSPITSDLNFNINLAQDNFAYGAVASLNPVPSTQYRTSMELALMRIYNKELTQAEITANYDQVKGRFNLV